MLYNSLNINRDLYFIKGLFDKCEKETNQYYIEQSGIESMSEEEIKKDINILIALKNSEIELKALKRVALRNASVLSLKYKKSHLLPLSLLFHKEERLQFNLNMVNDIYGFKIQINYVSKVGKRYYHYNYNISYDTVIHILNQILENKGLKTN